MVVCIWLGCCFRFDCGWVAGDCFVLWLMVASVWFGFVCFALRFWCCIIWEGCSGGHFRWGICFPRLLAVGCLAGCGFWVF